MNQLSEYELLALQKLGESIHSGKWSNEGEFLNIKTVPDYCKHTGMSYTGAVKQTKHRKIEIIFNTKYIIDNE